ncbi:hypothetical protein [Pyxidicoccus xibeiensis]|uniref:hypothetical protein n=1 Tax=Pyxidicoccus xibeiensis TaxID=2906759 RepID=UPI0020A6E846|nr:hypothetical protein [Pyxidicoccus xibeiensis]MCP3137854.1 hypothetical protein [Pyxidicoccus xibeiensis]
MTWSGVVAASLLVGCGGDVSTEPSVPMQEQQQQANTEPTGLPEIRLDSLEAIPLDSTLTNKTRSLVRAKLAQGQAQFHREIPVVDDSGLQVILRDTGTNGDETAGDQVFSAFASVDFVSHQATQDRIVEFQQQNPQEQLTFATFDNRELVSERAVTALSRDVFRPGIPIPLFPVGITKAVKPAHSLVINAPSVVNDPTRTYDPCTNTGNPNGVWTFNHLMTQMANTPMTGISPSAFTEQWLREWLTPQNINSWTVAPRSAMSTKVLGPWPRIGSQLDMTKSPFKLVAIVNRLDLGKGTGPAGYGGSGAGELRFVFAVVDKSSGGCNMRSFMVIHEYGVPKRPCPEVKTWAQQWLALSGMALGSATYNAALQNLTQQVVMANAAPAKPNGSAINQVRSNEDMLDPRWELREFRLGLAPTPSLLSETTTVLTPLDYHNNTALLANFINANTPAILANSYSVPLTYASQPFLGSNPWMLSPATFWQAPGVTNNNARHKFSLNTCSGCHADETDTYFMHINPSGGLSNFLAASFPGPFTVADPVSGVPRNYYEMRDRAQHLYSVAHQSCIFRRFDIALRSPH